MKKAERHRENRTDDERATDETHGRLDYRNAAVAEFCALRRRGKKETCLFGKKQPPLCKTHTTDRTVRTQREKVAAFSLAL